MDKVGLRIDGIEVSVRKGMSLMDAARGAGLYIPGLCSHPDLPPAGECKLCLVEVEGKGDLAQACETEAEQGMSVLTATARVKKQRQDNLAHILAHHPHACLTCAQREGCSRTQCSSNVPVPERCCVKFTHCEVRRVSDYIGIKADTPRYVFGVLPIVKDEPLFNRDYNLCIGCSRCVRVCKDVRGIGALEMRQLENGYKISQPIAGTLKDSGCKFCTACVEVCPTGTLLDKELKAGDRDAALVPCRDACPLHIDVPKYLRLISEGRFSEATAVVCEKAPTPLVLGTICFHPCESVCRRGNVSDAMAICSLKRAAAEMDDKLWRSNITRKPLTNKRVAIVGSGPSGLSAAYYLAKAGHSVTVYESQSELGGMLRYGIPEYRLPADVLQKDLDVIAELGVRFCTNSRIGDATPLDSLKAENDAVYIGIGAQLSRKLPIEGAEVDGVLWGMDFLRAARGAQPQRVGERVVVIGGGNVAIDVALVASRLGGKEVRMACLESRAEMPAFEWEIEEALGAGVVLNVSWGPKRIVGAAGKVVGIELMRCARVFDEDRRFNPTFDESITTLLECDTVILAIGQASDLSMLGQGSAVGSARGLISVDSSMATGVQGIFAGGEVISGPASVVQSMASGKAAASAIDRFLGGDGDFDENLAVVGPGSRYLGRDEGFAFKERVKMPCISIEERFSGFAQVELGYSAEQSILEASRCLRCDLRLGISPPVFPPEEWLEFNEANVAAVPDMEGVFQLYDENKEIISIVGTPDVRGRLLEEIEKNEKARFFSYEEDRMYTKRESELMQEFLQEHGRLPEGSGSDLDDLF